MARIEGIIFDLDGTVYLGENALPGAVEALAELRRRGMRALFVSNKPLQPREAYAAKLNRLGIPAAPEDVMTSAYVLLFHLARNYPDLRYYVIGEAALKQELRGYGLTIVDERADQDAMAVIDPAGIDALIVAFDRTLDYRKLNTAYQALLAGARFFATNGDNACPMPGGSIPDAGATLAALEKITGRRVELLAGKPSALMMAVAQQRLGVPAGRCLVVGDRLETDIRMGQQAGMLTAVTLTGVTTAGDVALANPPPDFVLSSLLDLLAIVE
jgi:NagD protein